MSKSPLFTPPNFFRDVSFHRHTDRTIGWLELFYDLVYVATFIQIGNFLSDNVTLLGFGKFLVLTAVVWWAWSGETFYQNRFVVDDWPHRILVFIQIFAIASLGLSVSEAFGELYVQFTIAYVIIRLTLVLMYWRTSRLHPESRELSMGFMRGFGVGIAIWLGSLLLPYEYHWVGWLLGIGFELAVPMFPKMQKLYRTWSVDRHHISERFGIFTIIVLGESFVKILDDAQGVTITMTQIAFSTVGLLVLYSLWWLYFSDTDGKEIGFDRRSRPFMWLYAHYPLVVGLVAFGVGAKKLFGATVTYADKVVTPEYRLLYTAAIVLYLVALALIDLGLDDAKTHQSQKRESLVHLVSAIIIGIIGLTVTDATPTVFVAIVAVVMVAQVGYSIYQTHLEYQASG